MAAVNFAGTGEVLGEVREGEMQEGEKFGEVFEGEPGSYVIINEDGLNLTLEERELRERFIERVVADERGSLPLKHFRVSSYLKEDNGPNTFMAPTFVTKTYLGAIIAYADWSRETLQGQDYWEFYFEKWEAGETNAEGFDLLIRQVDRDFKEGNHEEKLIEVNAVEIRLFPETHTKSASKR